MIIVYHTAAKIANKIHLVQKSEILGQTQERKMLPIINFHKEKKIQWKHNVRTVWTP